MRHLGERLVGVAKLVFWPHVVCYRLVRTYMHMMTPITSVDTTGCADCCEDLCPHHRFHEEMLAAWEWLQRWAADPSILEEYEEATGTEQGSCKYTETQGTETDP